MADVTVRTPQGELFTGPQERIAEFQKSVPGAQVLSPEEAAAAARQQTLREEQGGLVGAGVQFAESLIEGGTSLPIGQMVERAYGRLTGGERGEQEAMERMRVREQEQQAAALAGQAIGFGGAALLPVAGEAVAAGRVARAAEAATTLTRGIMGAGSRVAALAEARVAQEGVKRAIVGAAARGATEGAALGLGQVAKEAVLGEDISAELVAERVLTGAFIGGAGGALFEGLGTAAVKAAEAAGAGTAFGLAGAGLGFAAGGLPGAAAGGYIGTRVGKAIGKSAAAGERAALTEAAEREAFNRKAASGELRKTGDLTAEERAAILDRAELEAINETAAREEEMGTLDAAEAELVRQRRAELNQLRRDTYEFADAQSELVQREMARFSSDQTEVSALARRQLAEATDTVEKIAREFGDFRQGHMAKAVRGYESAYEAITGVKKEETMLRFAREMSPDEAASYARLARKGLVERLEETAAQIEEQIQGVPGFQKSFGAQVKQMRKAAEEIGNLSDDTAENLAKMHRLADNAKREFDRVVAAGKATTTDERTLMQYFQKSNGADSVRKALSDPQLFGEQIAATQASVNQAWTNAIPRLKEIQKTLLRQGMERLESNPYKLETVIDPAKVIPFMRNMGSAEQELNAQNFGEWVSTQLELQQTALRLFKPTGRQAKRIEESIGALQVMQRDIARARQASASLEAAKIIAEDARGALQRAAVENLGGVGRVLTTMLDLERRATMERMLSGLVGDADAQISKAAMAFVRGGEKPGKFVAEAAKATGRAAAADRPAPQTKTREAVATELATAAPKETRSQRAETALRQIATVAAVAGTPQAIEAFAYQGSGPLQSTTNPLPSQNVALALARAAAFLNAKAPPVFQSNTLQPQLVQRQLSDSEIARWNAYVMTAAKPLSVLKDLEAGTIRREQVETLRALYPAIYSSMQAKVLEALHTSRSEVSYSQRVLLGVLFGAPTDPTLQPASIRALQSSFTPAQPAPSGAPRATPGRVRGSFAADLRTSTESLSARGNLP
jgi:hypothetical protein